MPNVSVDKLRVHALEIAKAHHIHIHETAINDSESLTNFRLRKIVIPLIASESVYATAMHELGHLIAPEGISLERRQRVANSINAVWHGRAPIDMMIGEEIAAWTWAKENALLWTSVMQENATRALKTYTDEKERQVRYPYLW